MKNAQYILELKERIGLNPKTLDRYRDMLVRINQAIGHLKLADIRPQHLNGFYKNLAEPGIRKNAGSAVAKIDMVAWLKSHKMSRGKLAELAGIAAATVCAAVKGSLFSTAALRSPPCFRHRRRSAHLPNELRSSAS